MGRVAISRPLSGSHLMAYVLANREGWDADRLKFVFVGGLTGALESFAAKDQQVDVFLWDRFMTIPFCESGQLRQMGHVDSPWPCFCAVARTAALNEHGRERIRNVLGAILHEAHMMKVDPNATVAEIVERFGLPEQTARDWLDATEFAAEEAVELPEETRRKVMDYIPR